MQCDAVFVKSGVLALEEQRPNELGDPGRAQLKQNPLGILSQGTFEKQKGTVFLEAVDSRDIAFRKRVAGNSPLQFFSQPKVKKDRSLLLEFFLPLFGPIQKASALGFVLFMYGTSEGTDGSPWPDVQSPSYIRVSPSVRDLDP